ncbi:DUF4394 domain-containing protein [Nonomuraea endophytica]|uniref:DUF4394 domain-containing protein n=1 Tax=Nonomuraea endophytica TaxID=714136 RepID=A0A7W8A2T3_9ACTN|nr:DUF4394 domain-containing protein [Nonomuraea endophytica]MBB5078463.1 hypothetical protein [Nonomuraea endophytica]
MRTTLALAAIVACAGAGLAAPALADASPRRDGVTLRVAGLTDDGRLVAFRADRPGSVTDVGKVNGLTGDAKVVGIDYRVQNGKLYAVGDQGGVYTLSGAAKATKVSQLSVALDGKNFGVDFNPAANRLRVISDTGQNLRHNIDDPMGAPAAGTTATDGKLTNPPVPPATTGVTALGVSGAAYTNNDLDATTATTLFDADTTADQIAVQSPANAGNLAPTGKLGVDAGPAAGFDIYTTLRKGAASANTAYAALTVSGSARFYAIDPLTGAATQVGTFPARRQVVDIALPLDQS